MIKSIQPKTTQIHHELNLWSYFAVVIHNPELAARYYYAPLLHRSWAFPGIRISQITTICDSSSKKFVTILWLPQVPTLMCTNIQQRHCCMRDFSWGESLFTHTHLSAPARQPMRNVTSVPMPNFVNQWIFLIRDANRSMGKGLLTKSMDNSRAAITPNPTWMKTPTNLRLWSCLPRLQGALQPEYLRTPLSAIWPLRVSDWQQMFTPSYTVV